MANDHVHVGPGPIIPSARPLPWYERLAIGAMGGVAAAASKIIGLDSKIASALVDWDMFSKANELKLMILIHTPLLVILGAMMAYMIDESVRAKVFAIGVSAPALITPWLSNPVVDPATMMRADRQGYGIVSTAWADDLVAQGADTGAGRLKGLQFLLGLDGSENGTQRRYWVIVGSHTSRGVAEAQVARIKSIAPELEPFVGLQKEGNPFYPVIIGGSNGFLTLNKARQLQAIAEQQEGVAPDGAYLSDYPDRLPPALQ